jgi:Spy/CpxP family protein refolding chaperone
MALFAQENKEQPKNHRFSKSHTMDMFEGLDLSEKQKTEIKNLFEKMKPNTHKNYDSKKHQSISEKPNNDQIQKFDRVKKEWTEEDKAKLIAHREERKKKFDAEIQKILTTEQFKKLEENRAKHFEEMNIKKGNSH